LILGKGEQDGGVPHGRLLVAYAEAVIHGDAAAIGRSAQSIREHISDAALVDSAAIVATFNAIDRVADACGIPLEDEKADLTADLRADLGINDFPSQVGVA
jgi:alkylhydroperoxidase family enzyme